MWRKTSLAEHFEATEVSLTVDGLSAGHVLSPDLLAKADVIDRSTLTASEAHTFEATHTPISVSWENLNYTISTRGCGKCKPAKVCLPSVR